MEGGKSARSENMSGINALVSDNVDNNFGELNDASDNDYEKNRIHVESTMDKILGACYCVCYHQKYAKIKFLFYVMKK